MYTFTFRISANKKMFDEHPIEITIQAPGYYDEAVITKKDESFPCLKLMSRFWKLPIIPCGVWGFSFDKPFSPWQLFYSVKNSDCYIELETDYPGDLMKWPPSEEEEEEEEGKVVGVDKNGVPIRELSCSLKPIRYY